eukprot:18347-Heterococcus_DN1.PRE.1
MRSGSAVLCMKLLLSVHMHVQTLWRQTTAVYGHTLASTLICSINTARDPVLTQLACTTAATHFCTPLCHIAMVYIGASAVV